MDNLITGLLIGGKYVTAQRENSVSEAEYGGPLAC